MFAEIRLTLLGALAALGAQVFAASAAPAGAVPDDPDPQCWRAGLSSFSGGRHAPAIAFEALPGRKQLGLSYLIKRADLTVDGVTVANAPAAVVRPTDARAWFYYYAPSGARRCVVPWAAFDDPAFLALWNYHPVRLKLAGDEILRYDVRSALAYPALAGADWVPAKAPYGGVSCDQSNLHTHGLLVRPTRPARPETGFFGDYVLTVARSSAPSDAACATMAAGAAHAHGSVGMMRHRLYVPRAAANGEDWLRHAPHAKSIHPAGLYFFHPHPHGYSAVQLSGATAGMLTIGDLSYVEGPSPRAREQNLRHLLIKDMQATPTADPKHFDFSANGDPALCAGQRIPGANRGQCVGAGGKRWYFTVNGQAAPLIDDVRPGEQEIWRIVNASPTVTYNLALAELGADGAVKRRLNLQLLTVDGAAASADTPDRQKFPARILLMPGARVEFAVNAPAGGGEFALVSEGVDTGGDFWPAVTLARIKWPLSAEPAQAAAVSRETTSGGQAMARQFQSFARLAVKGPDARLPTPANPHPRPFGAACPDLTDRKFERVIHFVKNPTAAVDNKDLFGLISGVRAAGEIDPFKARFFLHEASIHSPLHAPERMTNFRRAGENDSAFRQKLIDFNGKDGVFTPAFGQPQDLSTICAVLQPDETHSEIWVIENWTNEIHNFHLHQSKFRLLGGQTGKAYRNLPCVNAGANACNDTDQLLNVFYEDTSGAQHDTVPIPRGMGPDACNGVIGNAGCDPGRVAIEVRFGRPDIVGPEGIGDFVFHCHILEHEDRGMMGLIRVIDPRRYRRAVLAAGGTHSH